MRNRKKMKKLICLLMSVGMVFSGNTFTGYSAQAETLDEIILIEDTAPVSAQEEVGEAISFEDAEYVSNDSLLGEGNALFIDDPGNDLPDADAMDDILFVDETAAAPAADSIEDVNGFESADDFGYIEYSDEFEKWLVHSRDFSRELTSLCSCFSENSLFFVPVCPLHVRRLTPASHVHAFTCRRS